MGNTVKRVNVSQILAMESFAQKVVFAKKVNVREILASTFNAQTTRHVSKVSAPRKNQQIQVVVIKKIQQILQNKRQLLMVEWVPHQTKTEIKTLQVQMKQKVALKNQQYEEVVDTTPMAVDAAHLETSFL